LLFRKRNWKKKTNTKGVQEEETEREKKKKKWDANE